MIDPAVVVQPPRMLTGARRLAMLRAAVAAAPAVTRLRSDLVDLLADLSLFDEAVVQIAHWPDAARSYHAQLVLAQCRLVPHDAAGDAAARRAATRAGELATSPRDRAAALALRAKAERRQGDVAVAQATLAEALALDPGNIDACKRLAALLVSRGDLPGVIAMTDDLLARGIAHPQVLNTRAVAQAGLGQVEAARATVGFDRFVHRATLDPPAGYADIADFNAAVAAELVVHPMRRTDPHGSASRATVRVDSPTSGRAPLATLLMRHITHAVSDYVATLPTDPHPWLGARPAGGMVHGTCAITGADGYETWHIHQQGWLSGVYYVEVPVTEGEDQRGCIAFGLDDAFAGDAAAQAYGETLIRPKGGMLMLFPSHACHRTFPHGGEGRRICMAFDMWPR